MARIRSIKPEFFKHLELQELESAHPNQYIMLVYSGLWTQCDKNGVFFYNAKVLKNEVLPYIDFDMRKTLDILEREGYFIRFRSGNREYGHIQNFSKYQFPSKNEKDAPAKYPAPPKNNDSGNDSENITEDVPDNDSENITEPEGKRIKEKGIQDKRKKDKGVAEGSDEPQPLSDSEKSAFELSELLLSEHRKEIPDFLSGKDKAVIPRWAEDIEKLIRIDKKPPETIRQVILWAKADCFWFPNIISGKKLREKFETLYGQMKTRIKSTGPPIHNPHKIASDNIPDDEIGQYFTKE